MPVKFTKYLRLMVRLAISAALVWWLLRHADLQRAWQSLLSTSLGWFALAFAIKGIGIGAGVTRWWLMLRAQEMDFHWHHLAGAYMVGRFFGSFLPSTIGLDAYRTYWAAVRSRQVARVVAVTVVEKVIGLLALSLLVLAVLPLGSQLLEPRLARLLGLVLLVPVMLSLAMLMKPGWFSTWAGRLGRSGGRAGQGLARMSAAVATFGQQRRIIFLAVLLGLAIHGATSAMYLATAQAVSAGASHLEVLFVGPLMIAATLVPVSIAGIGVREGTFVYFLGQVGVPVEQAAVLGFLGYLAGEIFSLLGGLVWLVMPAVRPDDEQSLKEVLRRTASWLRGGRRLPEAESGGDEVV